MCSDGFASRSSFPRTTRSITSGTRLNTSRHCRTRTDPYRGDRGGERIVRPDIGGRETLRAEQYPGVRELLQRCFGGKELRCRPRSCRQRLGRVPRCRHVAHGRLPQRPRAVAVTMRATALGRHGQRSPIGGGRAARAWFAYYDLAHRFGKGSYAIQIARRRCSPASGSTSL